MLFYQFLPVGRTGPPASCCSGCETQSSGQEEREEPVWLSVGAGPGLSDRETLRPAPSSGLPAVCQARRLATDKVQVQISSTIFSF